jgi:chromate transport protein ChrA
MSLPVAASMGQIVAPSMVAMSPLDTVLHLFNTNPYFIGMMMLILNLGGRFIGLEVTKQQEQFLQLPWVRRILIFTVLFVATRSIWVAFWATLVVVLFLGYLFNENSALCLFGTNGKKGSTCDAKKEGEMTPEEKEILHRLSSKASRYIVKEDPEEDHVPAKDIYAANMYLLQM